MMSTALPVERLSNQERVAEAAAILATGVIRFYQAQQESGLSLDLVPDQSVHGSCYHHGEHQP